MHTACGCKAESDAAWQVVSPKLQQRAIERAKMAKWRMKAIKAVEGWVAPYHSLMNKDGEAGHQQQLASIYICTWFLRDWPGLTPLNPHSMVVTLLGATHVCSMQAVSWQGLIGLLVQSCWHVKIAALGHAGSVNGNVVQELFNGFDKDGNGAIDESTLSLLHGPSPRCDCILV